MPGIIKASKSLHIILYKILCTHQDKALNVPDPEALHHMHIHSSVLHIEVVIKDPSEKYSVLFSFLFSQLAKYAYIIQNKAFKRRCCVIKIIAEE